MVVATSQWASTASTASPRHGRWSSMQSKPNAGAARRTKVAKHPGIYFRNGADGKRRYEVTYLDSTGRRRWQCVDGNLEDAQAALDDVKGRKRRGERVAPTKATFAEY